METKIQVLIDKEQIIADLELSIGRIQIFTAHVRGIRDYLDDTLKLVQGASSNDAYSQSHLIDLLQALRTHYGDLTLAFELMSMDYNTKAAGLIRACYNLPAPDDASLTDNPITNNDGTNGNLPPSEIP